MFIVSSKFIYSIKELINNAQQNAVRSTNQQRVLMYWHISQLQMYVNYYDRTEKQKDENNTIGILLCTDKNNTTILASKYELYLPKKEEITKVVTTILDKE